MHHTSKPQHPDLTYTDIALGAERPGRADSGSCGQPRLVPGFGFGITAARRVASRRATGGQRLLYGRHDVRLCRADPREALDCRENGVYEGLVVPDFHERKDVRLAPTCMS